MVDPNRTKLDGMVEMDETFIRFRLHDDPLNPTKGRSKIGRTMIVGAIEHVEYEAAIGPEGDTEIREGLGRVRLLHVPDATNATLQKFCDDNLTRDTLILSDGLKSYTGLKNVSIEVQTRPYLEAHIALPWIHRIFSNFKRWAMGVYHGLRLKHLQTYLNEYEFRFNRRRSRINAFQRLLGLSIARAPCSYWDITGFSPEDKRKRRRRRRSVVESLAIMRAVREGGF